MIKKDNVNYRAFEGDCHPVNVFVGENKVAGYVSETAEGQGLELSNTYNDSYEEIKVYGKSEQKAKWYQSERAITAGSYQVSAESGIYEVTIAEDLICTDDANKDRICFDSISAIGYRENMRNGVKTRTALTFTKVESSDFPVLPWTAYGKNLIPFEPFEIPEGAAESRNYPAPPLIVGETYYPSGKLSDGAALNSDNCAFILIKNGIQLWNKSPRSITITEELAEADTVSVYVNKKEGGKTVTEFQFELGSTKTDYEPFNPTPPESLTPSPDYPHQIYDLSSVMVTSRGRNLFDETTYPCVFNGNQTTNYKIDINAKTAGAYTLYCVISGMDGIVYSSAGGLISVEIGYSDSTIKWDSLATSSSAVNDVIIINTNADKKLSYVRIWKHDRFTGGTITLKNVSILEGTYTADTLPPFDKYRCTSATIPIESCCMEIDETLYDLLSGIYGKYTKDGKYYVCDYIAIRNDVVTYVKCINDETLSASTPFIQDGDNRFFRTSSSFSETLNQPYKVLCQSTHLPGITHGNAYANLELGVSKVTHTISISKKGIFANMTVDDFNGWLGEQYDVGMPVIVRSILNIPVETDCTDTWAQDLLGLKTAPYYTKLFADKEIGGISATYKHF